MFPQWLRYLVIAMLAMSLSGVRALGSSPAEDRLLRLVPANAAIVAGIEDPHHGDQSGRLLIVTHSDNVDLDDWIALVGVDDHQEADRLIEVAMPSPRGELADHLILVYGTFNGRRILDAAQKSGGVAGEYRGVPVVALKPSPQEQQEMRETRWLAVVDNNTSIFGTPAMVASALDRYLSSAAVDAELMKRLSVLKPDVNCWSILTMPGAMLARHIRPGLLDETGVALFGNVTSISVSVHYGLRERVDFAINTDNARAATALAAAMDGHAHFLPVADTMRTRFQGVTAHQNQVRGSARVAGKDFDAWLAVVYAQLSIDGKPGGQDVARTGMR
ncbi:MAG TPA: hypothetical protein VGM02_10980 [Acidobacteriaceae bacterium]|jgi:hypothetical protein